MKIYLRHYAEKTRQSISENQLRTLVSEEVEDSLDVYVGHAMDIPDVKSMSIEECVNFLNEGDNFMIWVEE